MTLPIRIVVDDPMPDVAIALQRGATAKVALVPAARTSAQVLSFDLDIEVQGELADGRPRLLGPFVQGPPQARFVYLCVGQAAHQMSSEWRRRVKVPLGGLTWELIESAAGSGRLVAHIASRGRDGTPACASVPLLAPGWQVEA